MHFLSSVKKFSLLPSQTYDVWDSGAVLFLRHLFITAQVVFIKFRDDHLPSFINLLLKYMILCLHIRMLHVYLFTSVRTASWFLQLQNLGVQVLVFVTTKLLCVYMHSLCINANAAPYITSKM